MSTTALLLLITASGCASRQEGPPPLTPEQITQAHDRFLVRWDKNGDGVASCDDIRLIRSVIFNNVDLDQTRTLSETEFRRVVFEDKSYQLLILPDLDKNEDGSLSFEEFNAHPHYQFNYHDNNGDCIVDPEEAGEALRGQRRPGRRTRQGTPQDNAEGNGRRKVPDIEDIEN
ncbi:hypothetical protein GCM10017044_17410 [Kordiimonas sediminis]|uniref:EF-hand domain-containing protein n=2 Tax=Kordiimonas sediminis TaxID=1735581 RepID=A0A919AST3_9PROT|nr:hypothetical protein GCM10017044_17410 [Kordiimonas sediminis]